LFLISHEIPPSTRSDALSRQPSLILFSLDLAAMDNEADTDSPEFEMLGWYSPRDAERLLTALEGAQIAYRTEATGGTGTIFVQTDHGLVISVESTRGGQAHELHAQLFGDALPNFESTFFSDHPPEIAPDDEKQV
jgi:hypothetical protein